MTARITGAQLMVMMARAEGHKRRMPPTFAYQEPSYADAVRQCAAKGMGMQEAANHIGLSRSRVSQISSQIGVRFKSQKNRKESQNAPI